MEDNYIWEEVIIGITFIAFALFEIRLKMIVSPFYFYVGFGLVTLFFVIKIIENVFKLKSIKKWEK